MRHDASTNLDFIDTIETMHMLPIEGNNLLSGEAREIH